MVGNIEEKKILSAFCAKIKELSNKKEFDKCKNLIYQEMAQFPNAPQPHNLLGIVLEMTGDHTLAMRHFRAAWALDPSYRPANMNLNTFGTFNYSNEYIFDDNEVQISAPKARVVKEITRMGEMVKKIEMIF